MQIRLLEVFPFRIIVNKIHEKAASGLNVQILGLSLVVLCIPNVLVSITSITTLTYVVAPIFLARENVMTTTM